MKSDYPIRLFFTIMVTALFISVFAGCDRQGNINRTEDAVSLQEHLIEANKEVLRMESDQIDDFIRRHQWKMEETSTGMRYMFIKKGIGPQAISGMTVKLSYTMTLLTGDTVYSASKDGPLVFEVGKGQVISGLEEAILMLHVGDRAKFIIPSHLAFGLIGDQQKIRHKASLVYDLEFISMY